MSKGKILVLMLAFSFLTSLAAAKVGLIVEFPDGSFYKDCINIADGDNGKLALEQAGLVPNGSTHSEYGFFLKCIKNFCDGDDGKFWAFSLMPAGETEWIHTPVGIGPGGSLSASCWNRDVSSFDGHYCALNGDILGFSLNENFPEKTSFLELCGETITEKETKEKPSIIGNMVKFSTANAATMTGLLLLLLLGYFTFKN